MYTIVFSEKCFFVVFELIITFMLNVPTSINMRSQTLNVVQNVHDI